MGRSTEPFAMTAYGRALNRHRSDLTQSEWWRFLAAMREIRERHRARLITPRLIVGEFVIDPRITPEMLERFGAQSYGQDGE